MRQTYEAATFFVLINGTPMINEDDTMLDVGAVDFKSLHDALQGFVKARLLKRVIVQADVGPDDVICQPGASSGPSRFLAARCDANHRLQRDIDPRRPQSERLGIPGCRSNTQATEDAIQREKGIGDDLVRVYPICTPLSRFLPTIHGVRDSQHEALGPTHARRISGVPRASKNLREQAGD